MFDSQSLLSRKGPLGAVLLAAYCDSRLKKDQVIRTNIPFSVEKILVEGVPTLSYGMLGYLLFGVVRIYSKKVEYTCEDSGEVLTKAQHSVVQKRNGVQGSSFVAPYQSITLPESFQLDKFIFEDVEVVYREHILPREEIMLKDIWADVETSKIPSNEFQQHFEGVSIDLETFPDGTPKDILSPRPMETSVDDTFIFDMHKVDMNIETYIQKFVSTEYECHVEMVDNPAPESSAPGKSSSNDEIEAQPMECAQPVASERQKEADFNKSKKLSVTVERSPVHNYSDGAGTAQFVALPTPVNKEKNPVTRKRKCQFDSNVVLCNNVVREMLNDASGLVCKRGRVPHTALNVWRNECLLKMDLTRPLIHYTFLDAMPCVYEKISTENSPNIEASHVPDIPPILVEENKCQVEGAITQESAHHSPLNKEMDIENEDIYVPELSVTDSLREHIPIAPETPLRDARLKGFLLGAVFERAHEASSTDTAEEELGNNQHEEVPSEVNNSSEADPQDPDGWAAGTRKAVQYLDATFLNKKRKQGKEQINLQEVLRGKSKKRSAKLFYQMLVLKTKSIIDVKQEKAYGDILVTKSSRWEDNWHSSDQMEVQN